MVVVGGSVVEVVTVVDVGTVVDVVTVVGAGTAVDVVDVGTVVEVATVVEGNGNDVVGVVPGAAVIEVGETVWVESGAGEETTTSSTCRLRGNSAMATPATIASSAVAIATTSWARERRSLRTAADL